MWTRRKISNLSSGDFRVIFRGCRTTTIKDSALSGPIATSTIPGSIVSLSSVPHPVTRSLCQMETATDAEKSVQAARHAPAEIPIAGIPFEELPYDAPKAEETDGVSEDATPGIWTIVWLTTGLCMGIFCVALVCETPSISPEG